MFLRYYLIKKNMNVRTLSQQSPVPKGLTYTSLNLRNFKMDLLLSRALSNPKRRLLDVEINDYSFHTISVTSPCEMNLIVWKELNHFYFHLNVKINKNKLFNFSYKHVIEDFKKLKKHHQHGNIYWRLSSKLQEYLEEMFPYYW